MNSSDKTKHESIHQNGMNDSVSNQTTQKYILTAIIASILIYHAIFYVFPMLYTWYQLRNEKQSALQITSKVIQDAAIEVINLDNEINNISTKQSQNNKKAKEIKITKPNFTLKKIILNEENDRTESSSVIEPIVISSSSNISVKKSYLFNRPNFSLPYDEASHRPNLSQSSVNTSNLSTPQSSSYHQLSSSNYPQVQIPRHYYQSVEQITNDYIRKEQDMEFQKSIEDDLKKLKEKELQMKKEELERQYKLDLFSKVLPDESSDKSSDVICISFRYQHAEQDKSSQEKLNVKSIRRRFNIQNATINDVVNYVESLEIRPLRTEFELVMNYPKRSFSSSDRFSDDNLQGVMTLKDIGMVCDTVMWIRYV